MGPDYTSQALHDDAASFFVFVPTAAACSCSVTIVRRIETTQLCLSRTRVP